MKIVLAHIGSDLPPYVPFCLRQYRLFNPGAPTVFIGGEAYLKPHRVLWEDLGIETVASESLKSDDAVRQFDKLSYFKKMGAPGTVYPAHAEFWHFAIERLFLLSAYMKQSRSEDVFHFENDVMIYCDLAQVLSRMKRRPQQMVITPVGDEWVASGLFFVDWHESLARFCDFVLKALPKGDERIRRDYGMQMVNDMTFLKAYADREKALQYFPILPEGPHAYDFDRFGSIFDSASWGQYAGGTNNGHAAGWAGEHHYIGKEILNEKYRLVWKRDGGLRVPWVVDSQGNQTRLNNLHVHSKKLGDFLSVDSPYLAKEVIFPESAEWAVQTANSRGFMPVGERQLERARPKPYILKALEMMRERGGKVIVEIGTSGGVMFHRLDEDGGSWGEHCCNSGHSTLHFAMSGAKEVWTVDINPNATEGARKFLSSSEHTRDFKGLRCITQDGLEFLKNFPKKIDFLYLDAWDVAPGFYAEQHLEAYLRAKDKLHEKSLILIDDTDVDGGGKGKRVVPKAIEDGWQIVFTGRQTLLAKK